MKLADIALRAVEARDETINRLTSQVIKRLKQLLNEINKEEDNEWFKP